MYDFDAWVLVGELIEEEACAVGAAVVDVDDFGVAGEAVDDGACASVGFLYDGFFIIAGDDDGEAVGGGCVVGVCGHCSSSSGLGVWVERRVERISSSLISLMLVMVTYR